MFKQHLSDFGQNWREHIRPDISLHYEKILSEQSKKMEEKSLDLELDSGEHHYNLNLSMGDSPSKIKTGINYGKSTTAMEAE